VGGALVGPGPRLPGGGAPRAGPAEPLTGLATLLGLGQDAIPDFPLDDVLARGAGALADWLAVTLGDDTTRAAWLGGLATLTGGSGGGAGAQGELGPAPAPLRAPAPGTPRAGARPGRAPRRGPDAAGAPRGAR